MADWPTPPPLIHLFIRLSLLPDCTAPFLVFILLYLTIFLYFPWVPCSCNNNSISAYLSKPMFTLEEQWWETQTSGLVGSTHDSLLTKTDIVKWNTPPTIKATTILHTLWISTTVKPSQIRTAESIRRVPWALVKQADLHFQHFHY